jgi:Spy/CpxP family protein refolding chaperone
MSSSRRRPSRLSDPIAKGKRAMKRVTLSVGVLVFISLICALVSAQGIPEEALKKLRHEIGGSFLVSRDKVQEELKLTREQKEKLEQHLQKLLPDAAQFFQKIEGLKREEQEKELGPYRPKMREKLAALLKETLNEGQRTRLRQLELQKEGLRDGDIWNDLQVTDEQRRQFMALMQQALKEIDPLLEEAQKSGNPKKIQPKVIKIRDNLEATMEALLTDAQKTQWKEMLGKPMDHLDDLFDL